MAKKNEQVVTPESLLIGPPERDNEGALTLQGMRQVLSRGGSIIHKGQHITSVKDLPDPIKIEGKTVGALDRMDAELEEQAAQIEERRARIAKKRKKLEREDSCDGAEETDEKEDEGEPEDLESMTKDQLVKVAEERGVEVKDKMTKADLIQAIEDVKEE